MPLEGLKPPAFRFVAGRSLQLSYSDKITESALPLSYREDRSPLVRTGFEPASLPSPPQTDLNRRSSG